MSLSHKQRPLYLQIMNIVKDRILHGIYPMGTNIPSEPQLEQEFNVSKITVRNAINELVQEGYLEKASGKGTKVIRNTSASKLSRWKRFTEVLVEEGHGIRKQLLLAEVISNEEGSEPYQLFGENCLRIERLYHLNDVPYIHYTHYFTMRVATIELSDLNAQSLYDLLEEQEVNLEKYRDEFAVGPAPSHVEKALQVKKGTPLLNRLRFSYDEKGELIEYSHGYYNTDMHRYVVNYDV
ncbi:GntR family transcriptional regulator [Paenibacillus sp. MZ04-78.2]|uniref:GntR family transcriptional regulator n=1 Tax=Paenibacillus sp. MZ04-78.2 TaxID=2962034 RepID=UPI0020B764C6|nr:GntR family transcriptional regulator [Paenibacillus sp. MZ04-78.2]MCP3776314.1 GntR family transcriptional regulator [Paenibacillus sp. MZ04-78.2]